MANSDKNIVITPNIGETSNPTIVFTGGDNNPVTLTVLDDGTLSFDGSSGQLFSITDSLTGTIFSVNDISGIPSLEVDDDGTIRLTEFAGNVLIGTATDDGSNKLQLTGDAKITGNFETTGNITVSGTVDGRDVAADGTKLDGIESGATADQTASEILTAIKTVDGSGSGLDADLLDGQHGSYYTGYTDTAISNLVASAPGTLDTLNELAAALGDDANFSTTVTNSIATKLPLAGGIMTGNLEIQKNNPIFILDDSTSTSDADTVAYISYQQTGTERAWVGWGSNGDSKFTVRNAIGDVVLYPNGSTNAYVNANKIFTDGYHPNADQWTTARTLSLTGDVTGSVSIDGSGNVSMTTTVADDSHTHDGRYYTESEADSRFVNVTGDTMSGNLTVNATAQADQFTQLTNGVPRNNLGTPSVTEMALFDTQFNNKTEYYPIANLKFYTSTDGTNWTEYTSFSDDQKEKFLHGDDNSSIYIPNGTDYFRIELINDGNYVFLNALYMYWSSNSHNTTVKIRKQRGDGVWSQHTSSTTTVSSWPGHLYLPFNTIAFNPSTTSTGHYRTVHFDFEPNWSTGQYASNNINLYTMQVWGGYPSGRRNVYHVDQNHKVKFPDILYVNNSTSDKVFSDTYHPNADKLTTARNIALTGDVTGNANFDGSANISITATVADDSHNHVISNVDGLQTALDGKLSTSGKAADSNLLDGLDSTAFLRSNVNDSTTGVITSTAGSTTRGVIETDDTNQWWIKLSSYDVGVYWDTTNNHINLRNGYGNLQYNGSTVWHAGNDGSGSGLDADLLDGQHASAFQTVAAPNAPSITSTTVVNETIELVFGQSSTSGITRYEVWSDGATGSDYSLIAIIPSQDAAASMSVVDASFDTGGTVAYRVYAVKNGVYSTAATTTKSFTIPSLDVTNMSVVASITNYDIQYDLPDTRFLDHIEIYKDAETTLGALSRTGAALVYSGSSDNFTFNVSAADIEKYHQFWVECVSV